MRLVLCVGFACAVAASTIGCGGRSAEPGAPRSIAGGSAPAAVPSSDVDASAPPWMGGSSSSGGPGFSGTNTPTWPPGAVDASFPVASDACWANQLPPPAQPILPTASVASTCAAAPGATVWLDPDAGVTTGTADARQFIVGRWVACSPPGAFSSIAHAGMEFGANGRWRLLAYDANGVLGPVPPPAANAAPSQSPTTGRYQMLSSGQMNVIFDPQGGFNPESLTLTPDQNGMRLVPFAGTGSPYYARTDPSPLNGADNPPSLTDGHCTMTGTWDLPASSMSMAATLSFDDVGNFVGGPQGSDLCSSHTMYGTYALLPSLFQITENIGMGSCQWWVDGSWTTSFSPDCSQLTLTTKGDNCTGGRLYLDGVSTLTRR